MFELFLTGAVVASALFAAARGQSRVRPESSRLITPQTGDRPLQPSATATGPDLELAAGANGEVAEGTDLPCPWCLSGTREDDTSCPSCGQPFG